MSGESGDEACLATLTAAVVALQATRELIAGPHQTDCDGRPGGDGVMDALRALEAARSARARVNELVMLLTERALGTGASMASLGYRFTDPPT